MAAFRTRRDTKHYQAYSKTMTKGQCDFCNIKPGHPQFVTGTKHFIVIRNRFGYSLWDEFRVADHLMIVPKAHLGSLKQLPSGSQAEYFELLQHYEAQGYSIYLRAPQNKTRTVVHQHTHLIKAAGQAVRFLPVHP